MPALINQSYYQLFQTFSAAEALSAGCPADCPLQGKTALTLNISPASILGRMAPSATQVNSMPLLRHARLFSVRTISSSGFPVCTVQSYRAI